MPKPKRIPVLLAAVGLVAFGLVSPASASEPSPTSKQTIRVDCDFPGGNIVLDSVVGDTVTLHQDLRDTQGDWFYWYFRVRGAAGRTLNFKFSRGNPIGVLGPAASADGGKTWRWLGKEAVNGSTFRYAFAPDADEVRFCFAMPYLEANLKEFLQRQADNSHLTQGVLCKSEKGRNVELLRVGCLTGKPSRRVLLTCRHHACEMMASYSLEGILESVLAASDDGKWFCKQVEFLAVPFMDKDGVEEGDQGKNRKPHDHNRDYTSQSIYASVRALRQMVPRWSQGRLDFALDMHCPHIRGPYNEVIYFVGGPEKENWDRVGRFSKILEEVESGPLVYSSKDNLPFGKAWNTLQGMPRSFSRWAADQPGVRVGTSIEIPYANAGGTTVTADSARALGRDLARALRRFLEEVEK